MMQHPISSVIHIRNTLEKIVTNMDVTIESLQRTEKGDIETYNRLKNELEDVQSKYMSLYTKANNWEKDAKCNFALFLVSLAINLALSVLMVVG